MRLQLLLLSLLLAATAAVAQRQRVSGTVTGADGPLSSVSVREIDADRRIYSHTTTDQSGLFSFTVRDARHSLQFYAPGYRTLSHKMLGMKSFRVTLEPRRTSPYVATAKVILQSDRLLCGHYLGDIVKMEAWVEKMNDTLFCIILPVEMQTMVDEYPAGRQAIVLDVAERQVMTLRNVVDVYPIKGDPTIVSTTCLAQNYTEYDRIPGGTEDKTRLYAYPHFQISRSQLEQLCANPDLLGRLAVDTYRADNYWNVFPTGKTFSLFRKVLGGE